MGLGGQSRGLIQASKTAGWDPTVIPAGPGSPAESIANFDKAPAICQQVREDGALGDLPGGTPLAWPDGDVLSESVPFSYPDTTRETKNRATRGADPFSGKQEG